MQYNIVNIYKEVINSYEGVRILGTLKTTTFELSFQPLNKAKVLYEKVIDRTVFCVQLLRLSTILLFLRNIKYHLFIEAISHISIL